VLKQRPFQLLLAAQSISVMGTAVGNVGLPLTAALVLHASAFEIGALVALQTVAYLFIGLPAGVWVDRLQRRPLLMLSDVARLILLASVPVTWAGHALTMAQLYVVAAVVSAFSVLFEIGYQSYVPVLVRRDQLIEANSRLEVVRSTAQVGGPTLGGWLVQLISAPAAVLIDAVSYAFSAIFLSRIRVREDKPAPASRPPMRQEIRDGLSFVVREPTLRAIAIMACMGNLFGQVFVATQVVFLVRTLHASPGLLGLLMSAGLVGGVLGGLSVGAFQRRVGPVRAIWLAALLFYPFGLLVPLASPGWRVWLFSAGVFICMFGGVMCGVAQVSFRQAFTPQAMLGKMNASMRFISCCAMPLGALAGGLLAQYFGARTAMVVSELGGSCVALPLLLSPLRRMRDFTPAAEKPEEKPEEMARV
jgi:MFS family permease